MKDKYRMLRRLLCLAMALALLAPLCLPAKAVSQKETFGIIKDSFRRTLLAVAVKDGSEILVFTSSQEPISVGTTGTFSIDGSTFVAVEMISNDWGGGVQRWRATESTSIGNSLYETAQPASGQDIAALYPALDSSNHLVARQTAASVAAIYGDKNDLSEVAVGYCLRRNSNAFPEDISFNLGLLLDGNGKAVGILLGRDTAWCTWYSTTSAYNGSGSFFLGDSEIASQEFASYALPNEVVNRNLMSVSMLYNGLMLRYAKENQELDYCAAADSIPYRQDNLSTLLNGEKIAKGVSYSSQRTITMGMGAGIADDSYWYLSLTFPYAVANSDSFSLNVFSLVLGSILADVGITPSDNTEENITTALTIISALMEDNENTAVTCEDLTFFCVDTSSELIIGVDSKNYYDNLNSSSIKKFKTVN